MLLSRRIGGVVRSIRRPCSCSRRVAPPIRDHSGVAAAAAGVASGSAAILEQLDPALSPAAAYAHLVEAGLLRHDDHQVDALAPLEQLYGSLAGTRLSRPPQAFEAKQKTTSIDDGRGDSSVRDGMFSGWFSGSSSAPEVKAEPEEWSPHTGLYLHGGVGCGKTFVLDLFFHCITARHEAEALGSWGDGPPAARVHFHQFMADVNKRVYLMRAGNHEGDPIPDLADQMLAEHGAVLCFDEFQVTDVADAMVINRLFTSLFRRGAIVVATSNRPPEDLYKGGLHRDKIFVPFLQTLQDRCVVHSITSTTDYRQLGAKGEPIYFVSTPDATPAAAVGNSESGGAECGSPRVAFEDTWDRFVDGGSVQRDVTLRTSTKKITIPSASSPSSGARGVARFSFEQLCGSVGTSSFGPGDYLAIGTNFRAVFIENVPQLGATEANEARRLISAIDAFYEHQTVAVVLAEVEPEAIFDVGRAADTEAERRRLEQLGDLLDSGKYVQQSDDETFAFDRCTSRLREMQSEAFQTTSFGRSLEVSDGASFLMSFEGQALDEASAHEIFVRYAEDTDELGQQQMKQLVHDLCMVREGHRQVDPEVVDAAWDRVVGTL
jgi:protein AFG1